MRAVRSAQDRALQLTSSAGISAARARDREHVGAHLSDQDGASWLGGRLE